MPRKNPEGRMALVEHFREFRTRTFLILAGLLVGLVAGWFLFDPVLEALTRPIRELQDADRIAELNFATVASAFDMRMRVALFISLLITSPWWLYQMWAFVAPGLKRTEKRYIFGFLAAAVPLFGAGAVLGWLLLPHAIAIFVSVAPAGSVHILDARLYLTFTMRIVLAFGIAFLFPIVMVALNLMGLVRGRTFLRGWRWAVVLIFTFAAFANPLPDPWTMIALGLIMSALYFATVGIAVLNDRRADRRRAAHEKELGLT